MITNATNVTELMISAQNENLPWQLGLILVSLVSVVLFVALVYLVFARLKKYQRLINEDNESNHESDDKEFVEFDVEKLPIMEYDEKIMMETPIRPIHVQPQQQIEVLDKDAAFSIGDRSKGDDANSSDGELKHFEEPTNAVTVVTKVSIVQEQLPDENSGQCESAQNGHLNEDCSPSKSTTSSPNDTAASTCTTKLPIRRVSSTPNLQTISLEPLKPILKNPIQKSPGPLPKSNSLDDSELFAGTDCEQQFGMIDEDSTLVDDAKRSTRQLNGSIGDVGSTRPLLPIQLPEWALRTDKAERGFLVFLLNINKKPASSSPRILLDVQVLEARCILSAQHEIRAGKFYVKARIQPQGARTSGSMLSLNTTTNKNAHLFGKSNHATCGSTPVRRAYRSPVFWHAITLETDQPSFVDQTRILSKIHGPAYSTIGISPQNQLELRLDLKERDVSNSDGGANLLIPHWKRSRLLGSVHIPLTFSLWRHFLRIREHDLPHGVISQAADELLAMDHEGKDEEEVEGTRKSKVLRFVRPIEAPKEELVDRGDLTFGMQYHPESAKLTLNPLKCNNIHLPRGANCVFLRATLLTNRKVIATQNSNPSARLNVNAAEFLLGERLQFYIEEHLNEVCLVLDVFVKSGRRLNETVCLIGRCVTGPEGLAYGQGLAHWNAIADQRRMIKHTHILFA